MTGPDSFDPGNRALVPLYPAGRSLFAARAAGREDQHPPNSGRGRRAHHRRDGARRVRPPPLPDRRRGPSALRGRRVGAIFDDERPRRPGLLGGPQCLRRRGAAAPAGGHLLRAAVVRDVPERPELLDPRSRRTSIGKLPEAGPVGHAQRSSDRCPGGAREHRGRGLLRLRGRGRRRDGRLAPPVQPVLLVPGGPRGPDGLGDRCARQGRLYAGRRARSPSPTTRPTASSIRRAGFGSLPPPQAFRPSSDRASISCRRKRAPPPIMRSTPTSASCLAGRIGLGAMGGPALDDIPANWRFYAGGGGSVRGYAFNSLGRPASSAR